MVTALAHIAGGDKVLHLGSSALLGMVAFLAVYMLHFIGRSRIHPWDLILDGAGGLPGALFGPLYMRHSRESRRRIEAFAELLEDGGDAAGATPHAPPA